MGVKSFTLNDSVTSCAVTGGTAKAHAEDGQTVTNGVHVIDTTVTDFRVQPHITFKVRKPKRGPDGKYSKGVITVIATYPIIKADGSIGFNVERYSQEYDPEATAVMRKNYRYKTAQILFLAAFDSFFDINQIS